MRSSRSNGTSGPAIIDRSWPDWDIDPPRLQIPVCKMTTGSYRQLLPLHLDKNLRKYLWHHSSRPECCSPVR